MAPRSRRLIIVVGAVLAVVLVAGAVYLVWRDGTSPTSAPGTGTAQAEWAPGTTPPLGAAATVRRLSSDDPAERRAALSPDLDAIVTEVKALPEGATLVLDPQGWRGDDAFAAATATLTVPGQPDRQVVIGFEKVDDAWLVTFEESV